MEDTEDKTQLKESESESESDEVTEEHGDTVDPDPADPDVLQQAVPSPGAAAAVSTASSLPGGETVCEEEDAPQTPAIPAASSTDAEVRPTTSDVTECKDVSEPVRETGSSDVPISQRETAGAPIVGSEPSSAVSSEPSKEAGRLVTTQPAQGKVTTGEAVTTQPEGETVTTQPAQGKVTTGEAVSIQPSVEAVTTQPEGETVITGETVSIQPSGEAVTTQPAQETVITGETVTTQPAVEAVSTQPAGADSSVTSQPDREADGTAATQVAEDGCGPATPQVETVKVETDEEMEVEEAVAKKTTPVISSALEESSYCSLDMGVDMVDSMDTCSTETVITQEVEKKEEEEDEEKPMDTGAAVTINRAVEKKEEEEEDVKTDSKSSVVNAVSLRESSQSPVTKEDKGVGEDMTSSSSSSGTATPQPSSTVSAGKDKHAELKSGRRKRRRVEEVETIEIKDEPVDEEYDKALAPSSNTSDVKDEPETTEDNLKISSVYTVPSGPTATTQVRQPPLIPASMCVACSGCKKILTKGQTAYQKKGSAHLFCSTKCLTSHSSAPLPNVKPPTKRTCHYCLKEILNARELIRAPVDAAGAIKDFCGHTCLSAFNFKRNSAVSALSTVNNPKADLANKCAVCKKSTMVYSHEVVHQGTHNKFCSDICFKCYCTSNQLSLNMCCQCGNICQDKGSQMRLAGAIKSFCNAVCRTTFIRKTPKTPTPCTMCNTPRSPADMVEAIDHEGIADLYCTVSCATAHKVQTVSSSGAILECENCKKRTTPAYHLAMSDNTIRNFCTLGCVVTFQEQFNKNNAQKQPVTTVPPPATASQSQSVQMTMPPLTSSSKLPCLQCYRLFSTKPEVFQIKDKLVFFCGAVCLDKFKKANPTTERCEYCKIEKVIVEVRRINGKDCAFCSEGCKLLYKHELNKEWGRHCRLCSYCASTSQKLVTGQFGGRSENFCSESCRSKFTMHFCQVAKCDLCLRQGKLAEKLPMLGEVKHFCDLQCLVQFCCNKAGQTLDRVPTKTTALPPSGLTTTATPVIANVVSLATTPTAQPNAFANNALQGAVPSSHMKVVGNASTQTPSGPPPPPPRVLKNKALLCKPIVQNKGIICKPQMVNSECQTDDYFKVMVLPVPVPVYIPVPMNLYTQFTPKPVALPIPVPVPMFLPVTLNSAERIVETILEIKEKIPSNPFEADILLMAEMVAEEAEEEQAERQAKKPLPAAPPAVQDDQMSSYSEDLNTDDLTSFLDDWQEEPTSSSGGLRPGRTPRPYAHEKLPPRMDIPVGVPEPPPAPDVMDIESDFPIPTLEMMAHRREMCSSVPSPAPPSPPRRGRGRKTPQRKKGGRAAAKEVASAVASLLPSEQLEPPRLMHKYGVDAWRRWVQWRSTRTDVEPVPRFGMRPMVLKEELLQCTTAELGFGLCRFINEVKRPTGEPYSPDSLFYLCLGIQQYLFENARMENIFTDRFYGKFTMEISGMLKDFQPIVTPGGYIHSRVEEDYLWDCKQLGAYSPIVLLNTLLFFCTKLFGFRTIPQHNQLSFGHVMRCTTSNGDGTKTNFLRFYPPMTKAQVEKTNAADADPEEEGDGEGSAAKRRKEEPEKKKEEPEKETVLEMMENSENPLRCPVRLYEFYLSKCSESVKQRTNLFYLNPERSCVPNSPLWYSSTPLDTATMETMLTRILSIREIHLPTEEKKNPQTMMTMSDERVKEKEKPKARANVRARAKSRARARGRAKDSTEDEESEEEEEEEEDEEEEMEVAPVAKVKASARVRAKPKPKARDTEEEEEAEEEEEEEDDAYSPPAFEDDVNDPDYWG